MLELDKIEIKNFKSLNNFVLNFTDFTCLIGLNNSGKSTILQVIDFLSALMSGNVSRWLISRNWDANELECKLANYEERDVILISIYFIYEKEYYKWSCEYIKAGNQCVYEVMYVDDTKIFSAYPGSYMIIQDDKTQLNGDIIQSYEGSFLASLKDKYLPQVIQKFRNKIRSISSLELLSPNKMKKYSQQESMLGLSGENISAFLNRFTKEQKTELLEQLQKCYPHLESFNIKKTDEGWNTLELTEKFGDNIITNEAKYLNDGVLRLIAILSQLQSQESFLLFDEIDNGINSELIEYLIDTLIASKHQVMITTHNPMVLNYIEDEVAIKSVHYIYKTEEGFTKSIPFFEIPSMLEKLDYMGAGEAYVDTNLSELYEEIKTLEVKEDFN